MNHKSQPLLVCNNLHQTSLQISSLLYFVEFEAISIDKQSCISDSPSHLFYCSSILPHRLHHLHSKTFPVRASGPEQNPLCTGYTGNTGIHPPTSGSRSVFLVHAAREVSLNDSQKKRVYQGWCFHNDKKKKSRFPETAWCFSHLDSILPHPNILLSWCQPPHCALSVSLVVLPLTRVNVSRWVAY